MAQQGDRLDSVIAKSACYCLNEDSRHPYSNLFVGDHTLFLQSDADEQLILQIAFGQTVSLRQLALGVPGDGRCPHKIKLFANKINLGFSDAADTAPTETITLQEPGDSHQTITFNLQPSKWNRCDFSKFQLNISDCSYDP